MVQQRFGPAIGKEFVNSCSTMKNINTAILIYLGGSMAALIIMSLIIYSAWVIRDEERHIFSFFVYHYIYHFRLLFAFLFGFVVYAFAIKKHLLVHSWPGTIAIVLIFILLAWVLMLAGFVEGEGVFYDTIFD